MSCQVAGEMVRLEEEVAMEAFFPYLFYPIQSCIGFSIAPLIGGLIGYKNAVEDQEKLKKAMKGVPLDS